MLSAPVPDDIADAVRQSAHGPVAVRSSATAEDLPHASFAGQQDTYLNVIGADAVLDAVRRCWASLWTDRAVAYRAANGIDHHTVRLAVVIQEMVQSEVAGVMFTANPVTGRRHEAVIDASPGLGEAVVSGAVNPDHFVVDLATGRITERRLGDKRLAVRSLPGGGVEHVEAPMEEACVTDAQIRALAELGREVEDHYGSPQDTEWAIDADGTLWLTQSRPITTLFPIPRHAGPVGPVTRSAPVPRRRERRRAAWPVPVPSPAARRSPPGAWQSAAPKTSGCTSASAWPRVSTRRSPRWACRPSGCCPHPPPSCWEPRCPTGRPGRRCSPRRAGGCSSTPPG